MSDRMREIAAHAVEMAVTKIPNDAEIDRIEVERDGASGGRIGYVYFTIPQRHDQRYVLRAVTVAGGVRYTLKTAEGLPASLPEGGVV